MKEKTFNLLNRFVTLHNSWIIGFSLLITSLIILTSYTIITILPKILVKKQQIPINSIKNSINSLDLD